MIFSKVPEGKIQNERNIQGIEHFAHDILGPGPLVVCGAAIHESSDAYPENPLELLSSPQVVKHAVDPIGRFVDFFEQQHPVPRFDLPGRSQARHNHAERTAAQNPFRRTPPHGSTPENTTGVFAKQSLAQAMSIEGGAAIIHRYNTPEEQAEPNVK